MRRAHFRLFTTALVSPALCALLAQACGSGVGEVPKTAETHDAADAPLLEDVGFGLPDPSRAPPVTPPLMLPCQSALGVDDQCPAPPPAQCFGAHWLIVYDLPAHCAEDAGVCIYAGSAIECDTRRAAGCEADAGGARCAGPR